MCVAIEPEGPESDKQKGSEAMNYEELYAELTELEKDLKESVGLVTRLNKRIAKNSETGNLNEMKKDLDQLRAASDDLKDRTAAFSEAVNAFDTKEYFVSGEFTKQLLESCAEKNIDVIGEKGVYEMFPYKVRIYGDDEHAEEVWINRKKIASFRPSAVADTVKQGQEKLYKAKFNEQSFMDELAEAYETTCLKGGSRSGATIALTKIYKTMTPMARARKEYDMQAFSFDLARLYEKGPETWVTKSGRTFTFGTSRDGKSGIRVLSRTGVESFITTLRPITTSTEE